MYTRSSTGPPFRNPKDASPLVRKGVEVADKMRTELLVTSHEHMRAIHTGHCLTHVHRATPQCLAICLLRTSTVLSIEHEACGLLAAGVW